MFFKVLNLVKSKNVLRIKCLFVCLFIYLFIYFYFYFISFLFLLGGGEGVGRVVFVAF